MTGKQPLDSDKFTIFAMGVISTSVQSLISHVGAGFKSQKALDDLDFLLKVLAESIGHFLLWVETIRKNVLLSMKDIAYHIEYSFLASIAFMPCTKPINHAHLSVLGETYHGEQLDVFSLLQNLFAVTAMAFCSLNIFCVPQVFMCVKHSFGDNKKNMHITIISFRGTFDFLDQSS